MSETREKLEQMGFRILDAVRTELLLSMRFMAPALNSLGFKMDLATSSAGTDAAYIRFNPGFLLQVYVERPRRMNRMYVHMLMHCLFRHMFSAREREDLCAHADALSFPPHVLREGPGGPGAVGSLL